MSGYASKLGVNQDNLSLYDTLNACKSLDDVVNHLKANKADLSYVLEHLPDPINLDKDLGDRLITLELPQSYPKLQAVASFLSDPSVELKARVDLAFDAFNKSPSQAKLNKDLENALVQTIKHHNKSGESVINAFNDILEGKSGIRVTVNEKSIRERALKEAMDDGDPTLAGIVLKPEDLKAISVDEKNLPNALRLFEMFPSADRKPLSPIAEKIGNQYVEACKAFLATGEMKEKDLNKTLLLLDRFVPEKVGETKNKLIALVGAIPEKNLPGLREKVPEVGGILSSMAFLVNFLNDTNRDAFSFLACLADVNENLKPEFLERGKSDLLFGALIEQAGRLFERACVEMENILPHQELDFQVINEVKPLVNQLNKALGRDVEIKVEMNVAPDVPLTSILGLFPDEELEGLKRQLKTIKNRDIFESYLVEVPPQGLSLREVIQNYKETGYDDLEIE